MKKWIFIFIVLSVSINSKASNVTIGSGSGAISQTSQGALTPGDTLFVTAGTYGSAGTISNITGAPGKPIFIMPLSGPNTVTVAANVRFRNCKYIIVQNFENTAQWDIKGDNGNTGGLSGVSNVFFRNMHGLNISGSLFNNFNNIKYNWTTQDTTTLACYRCKFDSITLDNCGGLITGSFGTVHDSVDVCLNDTFTRIVFNDFSSNGHGFTGIQFRVYISDITVHQTTFRAYAGDQGIFTFGGAGGGYSGIIRNVYIDGPVAVWIGRFNVYALAGSTTDSALFYNIQATNKSTFGGIYIQSNSTDWLAGRTASANYAVFNVSVGNCPTQNTYYNYVVDAGQGFLGHTAHIKNCIAFNNAFTGHTPGVILDESSGNPPTYDTSNNLYTASATAMVLDSSGTWPTYAPLATSPILSTGIATPYTTGQLDLAGNLWGSPPSKGPYMMSRPFVPLCNCHIRIRGNKTIVR